MIFYIFAAVFIILLTAGGYYFSGKVIKPKTNPYEFTRMKAFESKEFDIAGFEKWDVEEIYLDSRFGYKLHCFFYPVEGSKKTVVFCHGITWSLWGSIKYAEIFRELGFSTFVYDHRNHGLSGGTDTTFGYFEKYDLSDCIAWVKKRVGDDSIVGTHGESLGAATVLQNLAVCPEVDFCVADCAFSDLSKLLKLRIKKDFHLPPFPIIQIADVFVKLRAKFGIGMISPIKDMEKVEVPVLFVHGTEDRYIPPKMSRDMYEKKAAGFKDIFLVPDAGHAQSVLVDPQGYRKKIKSFLKLIKL